MRLLWLELKRVLKTRYVQFVLVAVIGLTGLLSYAPISFARYTYEDSNGKEITAKGLEAIRLEKQSQKAYSGTITPERIAQALKQYQDCSSKYENGVYDENMPVSEYTEKIAPVSIFMRRMTEVYADPVTGMGADVMDLTEEDAMGFYEQCRQHLTDLMNMEQKKHPEAREKAAAMYDKVEMPFSYYPGVDSNNIDYLGMVDFLMTVLSVVITAPIFSGEYQTESDQILRCTRHGRRRLAITKLAASVLIMTAMYIVCIAIYMIVINTAFGWEARQADIQFLFSAVSFLPMTIGTLQNAVIAAGYLTMLATIFFTLFLSSRCRSAAASYLAGIGFCILPVFIANFMGNNIGEWIRCILPSGGTGLNNSFLYALLDTGFVYFGNHAFWIPYVMIAAEAIGAAVFMIWTVRSYCRYSQ